jgi:hypothetical protein
MSHKRLDHSKGMMKDLCAFHQEGEMQKHANSIVIGKRPTVKNPEIS